MPKHTPSPFAKTEVAVGKGTPLMGRVLSEIDGQLTNARTAIGLALEHARRLSSAYPQDSELKRLSSELERLYRSSETTRMTVPPMRAKRELTTYSPRCR